MFFMLVPDNGNLAMIMTKKIIVNRHSLSIIEDLIRKNYECTKANFDVLKKGGLKIILYKL